MAADSLAAVAGQLTAAQVALSEKLVGRSDVPDHHALDTFFQTVKAVTDVRPFPSTCDDAHCNTVESGCWVHACRPVSRLTLCGLLTAL